MENKQDVEDMIPGHVDRANLFYFDIFNDARLKTDLHGGFKSLHSDAPDIFFTTANGGHWVVTRFDLISQIMRDAEHFSTRHMMIPKSESPYAMIPLNLDPPEHTPYRAILMRYFSAKSLDTLEGTIRDWAVRLIDNVKANGRCEFIKEIAAPFPVSVFMEMMGLPMYRFDDFRSLATEYFGLMTAKRRVELEATIFAEITTLIEARRAKRENDLISRLLDEKVNNRPLSTVELQSICFLLFMAGLDTVTSSLTFIYRHLAEHGALQDRLIKQPAIIPEFVEEGLRRYTSVNGVRTVKKDFDYMGAKFRAGDAVVCSFPCGGMDERKNPDPMKFDVERKHRAHAAFSIGAHVCAGSTLARIEMRILTEEWMRRIGHFSVAENYKPQFRAGMVMQLRNLPVTWSGVS